MTTYQLLQHSTFEPDVARLVEAYEATLPHLNLATRTTDLLTQTVAKEILEVAQTGEKDPTRICQLALARLKG